MGEELLESTTRTSPTGTAFYKMMDGTFLIKNKKNLENDEIR